MISIRRLRAQVGSIRVTLVVLRIQLEHAVVVVFRALDVTYGPALDGAAEQQLRVVRCLAAGVIVGGQRQKVLVDLAVEQADRCECVRVVAGYSLSLSRSAQRFRPAPQSIEALRQAQVCRRIVRCDNDGAFGELQRPLMLIEVLGDDAREQQARRESVVGGIQYAAPCVRFLPVARFTWCRTSR